MTDSDKLNGYLAMLNVQWDSKHGNGFKTLSDESTKGVFESRRPGEVAVYYDYWTDECADKSESDKLVDWIDKSRRGVSELMDKLGYDIVDETNSSGNGLYYEAILFRKRSLSKAEFNVYKERIEVVFKHSDEDDRWCEFDMHKIMRNVADVVGWANLAEWLSQRSGGDLTSEHILTKYEDGLRDWWGLGSVALCELCLRVTVTVEDMKMTVDIQ